MFKLLFAFAIGTTMLVPATLQAVEYSYCASGVRGAGGCTYATLDQCKAFVSGTGGYCSKNPRPSQPENALAAARR